MFSSVLTSTELYEENLQSLLRDGELGDLLVEKKRMQKDLKLLDEAITRLKGVLLKEFADTGLKEAPLNDEFTVVYAPQRENKRIIKKEDMYKVLQKIGLSTEWIDENLYKTSKTKAYIKVVTN